MSTLLLDTNIISYLIRSDPLAQLYRPHLINHSLAISFMTLAELFEGAYRGGWGVEKRRSIEQIQSSLIVIPWDARLCSRWGEVRWGRRRQPISAEDAWIAATALEYDCPLVTHNSRDFRGIPGLTVITENA